MLWGYKHEKRKHKVDAGRRTICLVTGKTAEVLSEWRFI